MKKFALLLLVLMMAVSPVFASPGEWIDEKAGSDSYLTKMMGMMMKGVHQVVESPLLLLTDVSEGVQNPPASKICPNGEAPGYVMGIVGGTLDGTYAALENLVAASGNIVYSLIPGVGPTEGHVVEDSME